MLVFLSKHPFEGGVACGFPVSRIPLTKGPPPQPYQKSMGEIWGEVKVMGWGLSNSEMLFCISMVGVPFFRRPPKKIAVFHGESTMHGYPNKKGFRTRLDSNVLAPNPQCRAFPWVPASLKPLKWLWVKNMYSKWNPGKWKHGLKPVVPWWFNFDSYPNNPGLWDHSGFIQPLL